MARQSTDHLSVLAVLRQADRAMTAYEILGVVRACGIRAATPVYRALDRLIGEGLVRRVETLGAYIACKNGDEVERPVFTICDGCGRVEEFSEHELLRRLAGRALRAGFELREATIELHGRCRRCSGSDLPPAPRSHRSGARSVAQM